MQAELANIEPERQTLKIKFTTAQTQLAPATAQTQLAPPIQAQVARPAAQPAPADRSREVPPPPAGARSPAPPPASAQSPMPGLGLPQVALLLLLLAALLVPLYLGRRAPRPRPAAKAPSHAPAGVAAAPGAGPPAGPVALGLTLDCGWPAVEAALRPVAHDPAGPPADTLPPVPLLRDFLRPLDPALDWIAGTPLAPQGGAAAGHAPGAGTYAPLRADFAEALRFALLFELPPLLAGAWAAAPALPFLGDARRGWCSLAPNSIEVHVTPDMRVMLAGLPVLRPALSIRMLFTFPQARLFLRGSALDAIEPGPTHVSAVLDWAGQSRPLAVLRPFAEWPGARPVTPPLQLHARLPATSPPAASPPPRLGTVR